MSSLLGTFHTEQIQGKTKRWKLYDYTFEQHFLLRKKTHVLLKIGGINGAINRDTLNENSEIGEERKSTDRLTKSGQEALYRKAQMAAKRMGETRSNRKRYREKIVKFGAEYAKTEQQFYANLTKIDTIIRALETIDDAGMTNKPAEIPPLQEYEETYEPIKSIVL